MDDILSQAQKGLNRQVLKHAAGTAIFCKLCGDVLDCSRTLLITKRVGIGEQISKAWICCAPCWDGKIKPKLKPETLPQLDILDGRELFKAKRKPVAKRGPRY